MPILDISKLRGNFSPEEFGTKFHSGYAEYAMKLGRNPLGFKNLAGAALRGGASSILPIPAIHSKTAKAMAEGLKGGKKGIFASMKNALPSWASKVAGKAGHVAGAVFSPLTVGYRMYTEIPGQGIGGGISKAARILGEEVSYGVGMGVGMEIGGAIGAGLGSAIAPGIGTIIGGAIGIVIGMGIGYVGSKIWNATVDVAEIPFRVANQTRKFFSDLGKQSVKAELGGGISTGNRTMFAHTMRQRALAQMTKSGINARSLLGREASFFHYR